MLLTLKLLHSADSPHPPPLSAVSLPRPFDPGSQSGIERGSPYFQYGDSKEANYPSVRFLQGSEPRDSAVPLSAKRPRGIGGRGVAHRQSVCAKSEATLDFIKF